MKGDMFNSDLSNYTNNGQKKNFFIESGDSFVQNSPNSAKHINDYDLNILKDDAYKKIDNDSFKLEYKIFKSEEDIKEVEKQIQAAKDINNFELAQTLYNRKKQLESELKEFVEQYNHSGISAKISGGVEKHIVNHFNAIKNTISNVAELFFSKFPNKISSMIELKNSLSKLENISKSVDELMSLQVPYGEASERYEQLSKYIIKANTIQASIAKYMR